MKMTCKQQFCLDRLAEGNFCTSDLSKMAMNSGNNQDRLNYDWAYAPTRELRDMGLIELTGERSKWGRRVYRITAVGRAALEQEAGREE